MAGSVQVHTSLPFRREALAHRDAILEMIYRSQIGRPGPVDGRGRPVRGPGCGSQYVAPKDRAGLRAKLDEAWSLH